MPLVSNVLFTVVQESSRSNEPELHAGAINEKSEQKARSRLLPRRAANRLRRNARRSGRRSSQYDQRGALVQTPCSWERFLEPYAGGQNSRRSGRSLLFGSYLGRSAASKHMWIFSLRATPARQAMVARLSRPEIR